MSKLQDNKFFRASQPRLKSIDLKPPQRGVIAYINEARHFGKQPD